MINLNLLQDISEAKCLEELRAIILKNINHYDFNSFCYGIKVPSINSNNDVPYLFSGYDEKWLNHYQSNSYHETDDTVLYSFKNIKPVFWSDELFKNSKRLREESQDAGLRNGVTYPIHGLMGEKGLFCVAGENEISMEMYSNINSLVPFIHEKIMELVLAKQEYFQIPKLTKREYEFLTWLVAGKNADEIAGIMTVCYRTSIDYTEKLKKKFKCTSKAQVIALAISKNMVNL